jgi:hypothetical protein
MSKSTLQLPNSVDELNAILADETQVQAINAAGEMGDLIQRGITLTAEAAQAGQADQLRNARPGIRTLNMIPPGAEGAQYANTDGTQPARRNPLAYTPEALNAVQNALDHRAKWTVESQLTPERLQVLNATLTTTTLGAPREWGASVLNGPRILHQVAGVMPVPSDAAEAEYAKLALPTATAASAEGATLAEYDASTAGTVTLGRFGRFTDLSTEAMLGTSATALIAVHQLAIAKDLDDVLITAVENDAGSPTAFAADVPAQIRIHIATLVDATAAEDPSDIFVLSNPADVHLLEDTTPTGGRTQGEAFQQFSGATVYPSAAVEAGFMTVANLKAGVLWFEARGMLTEFDENIKTGVRTAASSILGGYGTGAIGSYSRQQDVITG